MKAVAESSDKEKTFELPHGSASAGLCRGTLSINSKRLGLDLARRFEAQYYKVIEAPYKTAVALHLREMAVAAMGISECTSTMYLHFVVTSPW